MRLTSASIAAVILLSGAGPGSVIIVDPAADAREPQAAVDANGRIYVTYGRGNGAQIWLATSSDDGKTYTRQLLNPGSTAPMTHLGMRRGPRIAVTESAVVVTAIGKAPTTGDVLAWRSIDQGNSWTTHPNQLNSRGNSAREGLQALAAGPNGAMFCAWLDLRNDRTEIYGARSSNAGETWELDQLVYRAPEKSVCTCCHPSVAFAPDGSLYVMWRNDVAGSRDMYLSRSEDGGKTFVAAEKLGKKTWKIALCPMDGGAIAIGPDGKVDTAWTRASEVFLAKPGAAERSLGQGVQPWSASGPDGTIAVWLERRSGPLRASINASDTPLILDESANDPVVASAPGGRGGVVASWEKPGEGIRAQMLVPRGK